MSLNKYYELWLGIDYKFNPKDPNTTENQMNLMLQESIYEFILKLVGQSQNN